MRARACQRTPHAIRGILRYCANTASISGVPAVFRTRWSRRLFSLYCGTMTNLEKMQQAKSSSTSTVPDGEPVPIIKGSHVYLIDGSGYIFRAFHALPPLTRPSDGLPVGAVHGFCAMLWKLLRETQGVGGADPHRRHLRCRREDLPQRHLPELQGAPAAAAGRAGPAVPADPRRGEGLQRRLHRAGRLSRPTT